MAETCHGAEQKQIVDGLKNSKKITLKMKMCSYIAINLMYYSSPDSHLFYKFAATPSISLK